MLELYFYIYINPFSGFIALTLVELVFLKYPEANQRQITSLTGLNPIYRQSGTSIQSGYKIAKTGASLYRSVLFRECKPNCVNPPNIPKSLRVF